MRAGIRDTQPLVSSSCISCWQTSSQSSIPTGPLPSPASLPTLSWTQGASSVTVPAAGCDPNGERELLDVPGADTERLVARRGQLVLAGVSYAPGRNAMSGRIR